jgi:hypothetical protein
VFAEGVDIRQAGVPDAPDRLRGLTTLIAMPTGGLMSLGGSTLRVLDPRTGRFVALHKIPGDNLYRVAANASGEVLATWEKDPSIHYFSRNLKRHVRIPKPTVDWPDAADLRVQHVAFMPGGRDALAPRSAWRWTAPPRRGCSTGSTAPAA